MIWMVIWRILQICIIIKIKFKKMKGVVFDTNCESQSSVIIKLPLFVWFENGLCSRNLQIPLFYPVWCRFCELCSSIFLLLVHNIRNNPFTISEKRYLFQKHKTSVPLGIFLEPTNANTTCHWTNSPWT